MRYFQKILFLAYLRLRACIAMCLKYGQYKPKRAYKARAYKARAYKARAYKKRSVYCTLAHRSQIP